MMLDPRRLKYFVVTADELHFGRAAERLCIAQPPLTRQIFALEKDLGMRLFDRTSRSVKLTAEGNFFLDQARKILAQIEQAERIVRRLQLGEMGNIDIGYASSISLSDIFSSLIRKFSQMHPNVVLSFNETASGQQSAALCNGTLDVGFVQPTRSILPPEIQVMTLCVESFVVVLHVDHPLAASNFIDMQQLTFEPFILFSSKYGSGLYDLVLQICADANFIPVVGATASQITTIVALVAAGLGVSIVPSSVQTIMRNDICYVPLVGVKKQMEIALVYRDKELSSVIQSFINIAQNASAEFTSIAQET